MNETKIAMKKIPLIIFFLMLNYSPLYSKDLKWEDVVSAAEKNNADLNSARASVRSEEAKVRSSCGDFFPQLIGNGSYSKSDNSGGSSAQNNYSMGLTLQQSVFSGFRSRAGLEGAKADLDGAKANLALVESQIFYDLRSAFINVLYAQENVKLLKKIRDRKEENQKLIELRYQGGRENRGSYLRANAQYHQAKFEVEQAERTLRVSRKNLSQVTGEELNDLDQASGSFSVEIRTGSVDFKTLTLQTPLYRKSYFSLTKTKASLEQSKSEFYPSLSLSGSGKKSGEDVSLNQDSWNIGASVSYSFFSGGRNFFDVKQAKAEMNRASFSLEEQSREIEYSLENAFNQLLDAIGQADIQKQFLDAAEERAKIARAQYGNGLISYTDWDIVETDFTNNEKQALGALKNAAIAEALWIKIRGQGFSSSVRY